MACVLEHNLLLIINCKLSSLVVEVFGGWTLQSSGTFIFTLILDSDVLLFDQLLNWQQIQLSLGRLLFNLLAHNFQFRQINRLVRCRSLCWVNVHKVFTLRRWVRVQTRFLQWSDPKFLFGFSLVLLFQDIKILRQVYKWPLVLIDWWRELHIFCLWCGRINLFKIQPRAMSKSDLREDLWHF